MKPTVKLIEGLHLTTREKAGQHLSRVFVGHVGDILADIKHSVRQFEGGAL